MMKIHFKPIAAAVLCLFATAFSYAQNQKIPEPEMITNQTAPAFTLEDLSGKKVSLADYKGKVVVLDFWATWCGPCKASFPGMQKTVEKYKNSKDVIFLFIDTRERTEDYKQLVTNFLAENHYTFNVLYDEMSFNSTKSKLYQSYKIAGIPTKFIIDKTGMVRFEKLGHMPGTSEDQLVSELSGMIEQARKPASNNTEKAK